MHILCLGELVIDLIGQEGGTLDKVQTFRKYPGGAAANVAVGVVKLGLPAAFLGRVSRDAFGDYLGKTLEGWGVNTDGMVRDDTHKTTVAFVSKDENQVPSYLFYRDASASAQFSPEDLKERQFEGARILYSSSITLAKSPIREALYRAVDLAQGHGCLFAFDPNVRLSVWSSPEAAKHATLEMIERVSILKMNAEELRFLFGDGDPASCAGLFRRYRELELVALTLGEEGCFLMDSSGASAHVRAVSLPVVDTTGSGDSFMSAMLYCWIRDNGISGASALKELGVFCNSAAHVTARRDGVIPALPNREEVEAFIRTYH